MKNYTVELIGEHEQHFIEADSWEFRGDWLVFYRNPPTGGKFEYWRVRIERVVRIFTIP